MRLLGGMRDTYVHIVDLLNDSLRYRQVCGMFSIIEDRYALKNMFIFMSKFTYEEKKLFKMQSGVNSHSILIDKYKIK